MDSTGAQRSSPWMANSASQMCSCSQCAAWDMQWISGRDKRWGKVLTRRADEQRSGAGAGAPAGAPEVFDVTGTLPFVEAQANEAMQQRAFAAPGIFHGLVHQIDSQQSTLDSLRAQATSAAQNAASRPAQRTFDNRVRQLDLTKPGAQEHVRGLATLAESFNNAAGRGAGGQEFDIARGAYRHLFGPPRSRPQPQPQYHPQPYCE